MTLLMLQLGGFVIPKSQIGGWWCALALNVYLNTAAADGATMNVQQRLQIVRSVDSSLISLSGRLSVSCRIWFFWASLLTW